MRLSVLGLAFLLFGCASDDWTRRDTALELAFLTALAADAYTTTQIQYHPNLRESNPVVRSLLGSRPETDDTWQLAITSGVAHYLISRALPEKWRTYWQVGSTLAVSAVVIENCDAGLCETPPCIHFEFSTDVGEWRCVD